MAISPLPKRLSPPIVLILVPLTSLSCLVSIFLSSSTIWSTASIASYNKGKSVSLIAVSSANAASSISITKRVVLMMLSSLTILSSAS